MAKHIVDELAIGPRKIGKGRPCFIIAEAGVNHNGSIILAKRLIDVAKSAGADAIKFQVFSAQDLVTRSAPQAAYQKKNNRSDSQYRMLKRLELSYRDFKELYKYCSRVGIVFLATPFDSDSAKFLFNLNVLAFKISSGDLTNIPFLRQIAEYNKPVILSTGMGTYTEVSAAVKALGIIKKKLILMQCTTDYPARAEDINLKTIEWLRIKFGVPTGFSDHTEGINIAIAAAARGSAVIEKHLTLSKRLHGPDHKASLDPNAFKSMIAAIREVERALGSDVKKPTSAELKNKDVIRKSIVALHEIKPGERITRDKIVIKRPGFGIQPEQLNRLICKTAAQHIEEDEVITWRKVK